MAKRKGSKQVALFERILDTEPGIKAKLANVNVKQTSILDLQRQTPEALMAHFPTLRASEARRLKARLDAASAAMMRAFREKRLSTGIRRAADEMKGSLVLNSGPTFENQFNPSWANHTHPGAVDATTSPGAYLIDLLTFARDHIESQGDDKKVLRLTTRRPDLFALSIDEQTMNREVTQVEIVNHVMEHAIEDQREDGTDDRTSVEDKLLEVRYPFRHFPYETYWEQIRTVLAFNQVHLSDLTRLSDINSPYFTQRYAHSLLSESALQQEASLGPELRVILLEPPYFDDGRGVRFNPRTRRLLAVPANNPAQRAERLLETAISFYPTNFGVSGYPTLQNVVSFCQALEMTQDEMESLFGLAAYAPVLSENAPEYLVSFSSRVRFGARFLNSGAEDPVSVESDSDTPGHHRFLNLTEDRCDRLNRLVRLAHKLKLSYSETDQVVCAIIDAERLELSEPDTSKVDQVPLWMTVNTLRGLGLFQFMRERFSCSAEEFAALMSDMGVYAVGETRSHFDRVFNTDTVTPLMLDGEPFDISGEDSASKRTIDQLCRGLGINMETFRYLSRLVLQGQGSEKMARSIETISAFYRTTLLARLLSITTIELLSLLETLSPEGLFALQLAGTPRNASYQHFSQTDTLNVIRAVCDCVLWCQEQQLPISWLVQQLLPIETSDLVPQAYKTLFTELKGDLAPFLNFDQDMAEAGVPDLVSKQWSEVLTRIVDENGLIRATGNTALDFDLLEYGAFVVKDLGVVIRELINPTGGEDSQLPELTADEVDRLVALIQGVVLRIRSQQWGIVQERLSHVLALNSEKVIPVIGWADGTIHMLLATAVNLNPERIDLEPLKAMTPLLLRMQRRALVVAQFDLSATLVASLLNPSRRLRFSVETLELTLHTLYFLERYTRCLRLAKQTEAQLLDYFSAIEAQGELTANEQRLIKDIAAEKIASWLGWGIREVLDVTAVVSPDGIIRNLAQLLALVNTRQLCERTGLSAVSLMNLSQLNAYSNTQAYRSVAQEMLSSLRRDPEQRRDEVELRQSLSSRCEVSESLLIANVEPVPEATKVSLTLLDMNNQPISDIRIAWSTDLGVLRELHSYTDECGVAQVELEAGEQLGVAHVKGTYLMGSHAMAPPIMIDCDEVSLKVRQVLGKPNPGDPKKVSGDEGAYRFTARLWDDYGNPGIDRRVDWASEVGEFHDIFGEPLTNSEGESTIELRSQAAGDGRVSVSYGGVEKGFTVFEVGFEDRPYISTLVLTSWAVEGDAINVEATVLGLDGNPVKGQKVDWLSEPLVTIDVENDESDESGKVKATLTGAKEGNLTVTAKLMTEEASPKERHSKALSIDVLADASGVKYVGGDVWPFADGISAGEYEVTVTSSKGQPVANYPVTWSVEEEGPEVYESLTGAGGIARYVLRRTTPGPRTVTATVHDNAAHPFDEVTVMPVPQFTITLEGMEVTPPIVIEQPNPLPKQKHALAFHLPDGHPLLSVPVQLIYSGRESAPSLGLEFEPKLGSEHSFAGGKATWQILIFQTALREEVKLRFGISCKELSQPIWTDVVLKPYLR